MENAVILSGKRTPVGSFLSALSSVSAVELGGQAIGAAVRASGLKPSLVSEVIMGNVISAGLGQNPARQMSLKAGLGDSAACFSVNKVCASGMKAVALGATDIMAGLAEAVVAGGAESMSQAPHCGRLRAAPKFGETKLFDALAFDGLTDAGTGAAMGACSDLTATKLGISRKEQDDFCIESYSRALEAQKSGRLAWEIEPVRRPKAADVANDEEPPRFDGPRVARASPAFKPLESGVQPTATGANSSKLNDGACALVLASKALAAREGIKPLAEIIGFADSETLPIDFNISPAKAIKLALQRAKIEQSCVDFWEINEAFSLTVLANIKILGLDPKKVNVHGGAVSLGHPIGMSGARIILSLINVLRSQNGKIGVAAICNGGGGASAIVIRYLGNHD